MNQEQRRVAPGTGYQGKPAFKPAPGAAKPKPRRQLDAHEHILLSSRRNNSAITIDLMNGRVYTGVVCDFDRYSFSIRMPSGEEVCLFKHAIACFKPVRAA